MFTSSTSTVTYPVTTTTRHGRLMSRLIRTAIGESGTPTPITMVPGDAAPVITGKSYHYTTRSGSPIYHPSAYSKHGWSNMVYHGSTRTIVVGLDWVAAAVLAA